MFETSVPSWLTGLWQRISIEEAGRWDYTSRVFWLQTHSCFGDIRIPLDRPAVASFDEMSDQGAIALSHQGGFAGITQLKGDICEWQRAIDYQPFSGEPDAGRLYWDGDVLVEEGIHVDYVERWQRVQTGPTAAMTGLVEGSWRYWLVVCGNTFIFSADHRAFLPATKSLTELVTPNQPAAPVSAAQRRFLNCEISLGQCQSEQQPWQIKYSTFPWREGQCLWADANGQLSHFEVDTEANHVIQTSAALTLVWDVQEWGQLSSLLMA